MSKRKLTERQQEILEAWIDLEKTEPDISTEMLFHRVEADCNAETDEICRAIDTAAALGLYGWKEEKEKPTT